MSPTDPHPWTAVRYLTERLFQKMKEDFPRADMDYVFEESVKHCKEAWPTMTKEQKQEYLELAANDKSKRDGSKSGKRKNQDTPEKEKANAGSAKKPKAPKDPLKPKKPMGAYFLYLNEKRPFIREEFPDLSMTDVSKKASEMYKQLSNKEKQSYEKRFKKELAQYEEALAEYAKNNATEK